MTSLSWLKVRERGSRLRCYSVQARTLALAVFVLCSGVPVHAGMIINATFDSSLSATDQAAINTAISDYEATFTNNVTVSIYFTAMSTGLGQSVTGIYDIGYASFRTALNHQFAISGNADQGTALANLPTGLVNPVNGTQDLNVSSADGRALGLNTPGFITVSGQSGTFDGMVSLNTSITFPPGINNGHNYSLVAVAQHEIDEVLGTGSNVGGTGFFSHPTAEDLYRFERNSSTRSYTTSGDNAWFSIDGGKTDLVQFNQQDVGSDYGDWHTSSIPRVQDAFGTPGATETILTDGGAEVTALNVLGYDISPVPEPSTLSTFRIAILGVAVWLGYGWNRRRRTAA